MFAFGDLGQATIDDTQEQVRQIITQFLRVFIFDIIISGTPKNVVPASLNTTTAMLQELEGWFFHQPSQSLDLIRMLFVSSPGVQLVAHVGDISYARG
jgi:hypothetical protein